MKSKILEAVRIVEDLLGYSGSPCYLRRESFHRANNALYTLHQASSDMGVIGVFGRWEGQVGVGKTSSKRFLPLVYVVAAENAEVAKIFHRKIWSQGIVPLTVFVTDSHVYPNIGFGFSFDAWEPGSKRIPLSKLSVSEMPGDLHAFQAARLISHIGIRDLLIHPEYRVDRRLLTSLKGLREYLVVKGLVDPQLTNLLIGRFLYLYALLDRGLLADSWLAPFGGGEDFREDSRSLTAKKCWALFDAIDGMLNGSIFPIPEAQRKLITDDHVHALRNCLKLGHKFESAGQQLSFVDFDLSTIQTETLSAIYEDFIDVESKSNESSKRKDGAFYTPPFLVDFVVDRVDEIYNFQAGIKVLDGTAGSGAFLVAAYRRIVERVLAASGTRTLKATELQALLLDSIYGIEKTSSACAVAAFGLYLTMLDYADPKEISTYIHGRQRSKLFPPLLNTNLLCNDLFSYVLQENCPWRNKFDVILGNPPWNKLGLVTDCESEILARYGDGVDGKEAAETAVLALMDCLLTDDGVAGFVLPTKSLVGPSSVAFPGEIFSTYTVCGIANLSHLRYRLFSDARQAASALLLKKRKPTGGSVLWTYSPLRPQLVTDKKLDIWFLSLDKSKVEHLRQRHVLQDEDALFSQLMLKPIDRHIRRYVESKMEFGGMLSIGIWLANQKFQFGRGGSPAQTNLPAEKLLGSDKFKDNDYRDAPGVELVGQSAQAKLALSKESDYKLSKEDLKGVAKNFKSMFGGTILIVPRSMKGIAYCEHPVAFGSSLNAVFASDIKNKNSTRAKLKVLGKYLCTDVAEYFFAIYGKQWILDQARLEKNDLMKLPFPFPSESNWEELSEMDEEEFAQRALEGLGFNGWVKDAIEEYKMFRIGYHDGKVPEGFSTRMEKNTEIYESVMTSILQQSFPRAKIALKKFSDTICVDVLLDSKRMERHEPTEPDIPEDETFLFDPNQWSGRIEKPNEKFRWTAESAYADSTHLLRILTS